MMNKRQHHGFTLVEMIIVIVITGIIGGIVAVFLQLPVQGYVDSARRAEMTDTADTALRRISRDLHLAVPNSVRVRNAAGAATCSGAETCYLEFIPTVGGGRYRADIDTTDSVCPGGNADDDILSFDAADGCFEVLGAMPPGVVAGDQIVVYNLGIPGADAYAGANRRAVAAAPAGSAISIVPTGVPFPFDSCVREGGVTVGGCRFQVARLPVTYVCTPVAGGAGGTLVRWQEAAFVAAPQPIAVPAGQPVLANNVSACNFNYDPSLAPAPRSGLVTMHLTISEAGENVTLYAATHVNNVP
ncbi:MAG: prepilin-type N-terminal cleavage/methylation domain-containing protein [Nitrosomonadales bacterium]|nr:prepilin-type N-terminal cleavage/methylation domain-containing protein [Nitrosomonadales bacterium]